MRERVNQLLIHAVGGAQMKFALPIVEHIDRAGLGAGELHRLGDDGGEHGFEIERRVHRLRHFAERAQLADRAAKFIGALAQFVEQSRILDGDDRLVGESGDQLDLLLGERLDLWRARTITPIGSPSRISGTPSEVRICRPSPSPESCIQGRKRHRNLH